MMINDQKSKNLLFLKSSFARKGVIENTEDVLEWLKEQNAKVNVNIKRTAFSQLDQWGKYEACSCIKHSSGKFFSIDGIEVNTNWGNITSWHQPIINQPEVGYLGIIVKEFDGVLHFLMQAKIEPGNINYVQLSPTLQATRSNYLQVHKGKKPLYLDYFANARPDQILLDQLQSEQGARFLKKRNRNIIVRVDEEIEVHDNFIWLTLCQIKKLMKFDNVVNMDTRTVISGIPLGNFTANVVEFLNFIDFENSRSDIQKEFLISALTTGKEINTTEAIITFLTRLKSLYDLDVKQVPLDKMDDWIFDDKEIYRKDRRFFRVIPVEVEIESREVKKWHQPMVEPAQQGLSAIVCKVINGVLHVAVQAKLECGNHDIIEFAPTVQCLTGNYRTTKPGTLPFLEYVLNARADQIYYDTYQSEEGGRFFQEQNRNMIILADDTLPETLPENYIWMTLNQLYMFLRFNNFLNIQLRSLIAAIDYN